MANSSLIRSIYLLVECWRKEADQKKIILTDKSHFYSNGFVDHRVVACEAIQKNFERHKLVNSLVRIFLRMNLTTLVSLMLVKKPMI